MERLLGRVKLNFYLLKLFVLNIFTTYGLPRWISYRPHGYIDDDGSMVMELEMVDIDGYFVVSYGYRQRLLNYTHFNYVIPQTGSIFLRLAILDMICYLLFNKRVHDVSGATPIVGSYRLKDNATSTTDGFVTLLDY